MESKTISKNGASPKNRVNNGNLIYLMTAVLLLMTTFASCKKDSSSSGSGNEFVLYAKVVDGDEYNGKVANVEGWVGFSDDNKYVAASGKYENGGFRLTLSETVPEKYLRDVTDGFNDFEGTISDLKAKTNGFGPVQAFNKDIRVGGFWQADNEYGYWVWYVYADRNVTIKGNRYNYDDFPFAEFDCSYTKGWNILYAFDRDDGIPVKTTQKPSEVDYKWYGNVYLIVGQPESAHREVNYKWYIN